MLGSAESLRSGLSLHKIFTLIGWASQMETSAKLIPGSKVKETQWSHVIPQRYKHSYVHIIYIVYLYIAHIQMCKAWCVVQGRIFKKNRNQPSRVNMTPPTFDSPTKVCICSDPQLDFVWKFRSEPPKGGKSVKNIKICQHLQFWASKSHSWQSHME